MLLIEPGFYHPCKRMDENDLLISVLYPGFIQVRNAARDLSRRANFSLGMNDIDAAIIDMVAINKLGSKMQMRGSSLLQKLVGISINRISFQVFENILANDQLSRKHLQLIRDEYFCEEPSSLLDALQRREFYFLLECMQSFEAGSGQDLADAFGVNSTSDSDSTFAQSVQSKLINWEIAAQSVLDVNLEVCEKCKIADDFERLAAWEQFESDIDDAFLEPSSGLRAGMRWFAGARSRGFVQGWMFAAMMLSSYSGVDVANVKQKIYRDLSKIGLCIEEYRIRNGGYPRELNELVPDFLESIPVDRFSNRPLNYKLTDNYYIVGSVGEDGISELPNVSEGAPENELDESDDILLKVRLKK